MSEKRVLTRIQRTRKLTPEEAARDNEIRAKVMQEFPPSSQAPVPGVQRAKEPSCEEPLMQENLRGRYEQLKTLALEAKHAIEQAEAKVESFNDIVHQLGGIIPREIFLGQAISRPYDCTAGIVDSGLVIQAALIIPEGFGVCRFDSEEYCELQRHQDGVECAAHRYFVPFTECDRAEKAMLNSEINSLFERFCDFCTQYSISK